MRANRLWPVHVVLAVGAAAMVLPFVWEVLTSLKTFTDSTKVPPVWIPTFEWSNFAKIFEQTPFLDQFWNSVVMTVIRTLGQLMFCSMAAYAFARLRFPGRNAIFLVLLSVLMVPGELFLVPQYQIIQGLGWLDTLPGLVGPGVFSAFGTFMLRQFFLGLPSEIEEAARIDGAHPLRIFWSVMLPLARPGLMALGVLTVMWSWKDLMWPLIVTTTPAQMPLSAGLSSLQQEHLNEFPVLMAGSLLASLPMIVLFVVMQRQIIQGIAFTGSK